MIPARDILYLKKSCKNTSNNVRPSGRSGTEAALAVSTIGSATVVVGLDEGGDDCLVCLFVTPPLGAGFKRGPTVFRLARSTLNLTPASSASDRDPFVPFGLLKSDFLVGRFWKIFFTHTLEVQVDQG